VWVVRCPRARRVVVARARRRWLAGFGSGRRTPRRLAEQDERVFATGSDPNPVRADDTIRARILTLLATMTGTDTDPADPRRDRPGPAG
jgi:hypothetical protein